MSDHSTSCLRSWFAYGSASDGHGGDCLIGTLSTLVSIKERGLYRPQDGTIIDPETGPAGTEQPQYTSEFPPGALCLINQARQQHRVVAHKHRAASWAPPNGAGFQKLS
jgi:hypothetical protein